MTRSRLAAIRGGLVAAGFGLLAIPLLAVGLSGTASADALWTALRLAALEAFTLIFANIVIGAFRPLFNRVMRPRIVQRLHVATGTTGFCLTVAHAVMILVFGLSGYSRGVTLVGPVIITLLAVAILAALVRRRLRSAWQWVHRVNYVLFVVILVHGFVLGHDFGSAIWLKAWFGVCLAVVVAGFVYRLAHSRKAGVR